MVKLRKFSSGSSWVVLDLEDAPCFGPTTLGPKVLQVNAKAYARAGTYRFAVLGENFGGGGGGVKVSDEEREGIVSGFVTEAAELAAANAFHTSAGWGLTEAELEPLHSHDPRNPVFRESATTLEAAGLAATARAALGGDVAGKRLAVGQAGAAVNEAVAELIGEGALLVGLAGRTGAIVDGAGISADRLTVKPDGEASAPDVAALDVDVWFGPSAKGAVAHGDAADAIGADHVIGTGDLAVTPRAIASLRRRDVEVWPDWLALIGPTLAGLAPTDDTLDEIRGRVTDRVGQTLATAADHPDGPFIGACVIAEDHLRSWRDEIPFGRPLP